MVPAAVALTAMHAPAPMPDAVKDMLLIRRQRLIKRSHRRALCIEFGGQPPALTEEEEEAQMQVVTIDEAKAQAQAAGAAGTGKLEGRLMVKERRTTGGVSWSGGSCCLH